VTTDLPEIAEWIKRYSRHPELGVAVPQRVDVRTKDAAFSVFGIAGHSTGFTFMFAARLRVPDRLFLNPPRARGWMGLGRSWAPYGFTLDIEYADGRNLGALVCPWPPHSANARIEQSKRDGTTLRFQFTTSSGADRTGRSWNSQVWVGPLPPPGPLAFVYEWPDYGIELTRHEIDAQPIIDAAARSKPLW
jgi:hypothetical protein